MTEPAETRETRNHASEIKFLVDPSVADAIRAWARPQLAADPHAAGVNGDEYRTTTIYFDTARFDVYHRRGSFGRSKLRVRRYGESSMAFLERKLRTANMLSKRRALVPLKELDCLEHEDPPAEWAGTWFLERMQMRRLRPVGLASYRRTARVSMTDYGPARLTLDDDLRAARVDRPEFIAEPGEAVAETRTILEMKFRVAMPALFKRLVEEFGLEPARVSKYRLAIDVAQPDEALASADPTPALQVSNA